MIDPTVQKIGPTNIGTNTFIGPFCVLGFPCTDSAKRDDATNDCNSLSYKILKIGNNCEFLSHNVIGEGTIIGSNVWCDHQCYIGCSTIISDNVEIMYGARIYNRVKIGERAWIGGFVCNDAIIEPKAVVLGKLIHKFTNAREGVPEKAPVVREGAFIGMNAIVIGEIEIGAGAYIGAGSVLTKSALPSRLYIGNPAMDIGPAPNAFQV